MWMFDATPLIYLAKVDRLTIVDHIERSCVIPTAVYDEVVTTGIEHGAPDARRIERRIEDDRFEVVSAEPSPLRSRLQQNTNLSEADIAVLACAHAHDGVAVMEEQYGRDVAAVEGITTKGTAFLILKLATRDSISVEDARAVIDAMIEEGWYCSPAVYAKIVQTLETVEKRGTETSTTWVVRSGEPGPSGQAFVGRPRTADPPTWSLPRRHSDAVKPARVTRKPMRLLVGSVLRDHIFITHPEQSMDMAAESGNLDLEAIREVIAHHPVDLAVLFGSQIRGQSSVESDIDIAVAFDDSVDPDDRLSARIDLIVDLSARLGTDDIDIADLASIKPIVGEHAMRTGTLLIGDEAGRQTYLDHFHDEQNTAPASHEERMERFRSIVERLEAKL